MKNWLFLFHHLLQSLQQKTIGINSIETGWQVCLDEFMEEVVILIIRYLSLILVKIIHCIHTNVKK